MQVSYAVDNLEYRFSDSDVANPDDWIPANDGSNPHNVRPWLLHDHGFTLAVVFASNLQDALDSAVDEGKLDRFQISPEDLRDDYKYNWETGEAEYGSVALLGNASEPFDIESLGVVELPNPPRSFVAQFAAAFQKNCKTAE